jgi:hypothetical protein
MHRRLLCTGGQAGSELINQLIMGQIDHEQRVLQDISPRNSTFSWLNLVLASLAISQPSHHLKHLIPQPKTSSTAPNTSPIMNYDLSSNPDLDPRRQATRAQQFWPDTASETDLFVPRGLWLGDQVAVDSRPV